jgi:hypothetical protein
MAITESVTPAPAPATAAPGNAAPDPSKPVVTPATVAPVVPPVVPAAELKPEAAKPGPAAQEKPKEGELKELVKEDLKLPEGSPLDPKTVDEIVALAKDKKWDKDTAQAVLEREHKLVASYVEGEKVKLTEVQEQWGKAAAEDKEYGGPKFGENAEMAKRVVRRFGSDALEKALDDSKLGNHPELVRLLVRVGKAMSADQWVTPGAVVTGGKKKPEDSLYDAPAKPASDEKAKTA